MSSILDFNHGAEWILYSHRTPMVRVLGVLGGDGSSLGVADALVVAEC
jgi:hypothetical protein